jgi:hypothetical protein
MAVLTRRLLDGAKSVSRERKSVVKMPIYADNERTGWQFRELVIASVIHDWKRGLAGLQTACNCPKSCGDWGPE